MDRDGSQWRSLRLAQRLGARRRRRELTVDAGGIVGTTGRRAWFLPGKFRLCPACGDQPAVQAREINKVASLSAEGRSSATTLLVSSALRWMNTAGASLPPDRRKLLAFTDNRQDAALQAGHFNDFLFVALLRAATLAAVRAAGPDGLVGGRIRAAPARHALGFNAANRERRKEWMLDPEVRGVAPDRGRAHARARAGAPRLGRSAARMALHQPQSGRVRASPCRLCSRSMIWLPMTSAFANAPTRASHGASHATRREALLTLLDHLRHGLAITTDALDPGKRRSPCKCFAAEPARALVNLAAGRASRLAAALIIDAPRREEAGVRGETLIVRGGARSMLARRLGRAGIWGKRLDSKTYREVSIRKIGRMVVRFSCSRHSMA